MPTNFDSAAGNPLRSGYGLAEHNDGSLFDGSVSVSNSSARSRQRDGRLCWRCKPWFRRPQVDLSSTETPS